MTFEADLIKLVVLGKKLFKWMIHWVAFLALKAPVISSLAAPSASVCASVVSGGLSAGGILDVAMIQRL